MSTKTCILNPDLVRSNLNDFQKEPYQDWRSFSRMDKYGKHILTDDIDIADLIITHSAVCSRISNQILPFSRSLMVLV